MQQSIFYRILQLNGLLIESYKLKIFLIVNLTILITKHLIKMNSLRSISTFIFSILVIYGSHAQTPCDADHIVLLTNFEFTPSELTILPGESVAFINIEGNHTVNGNSSTVADTSFNNPVEFFLDETVGTVSGTCMGVIDFDIPGTYSFDCSLDFNAQLGMVGKIIVDAFTLQDLLQYNDTIEAWQSTYAINAYIPEVLNGNQQITVFLPNDAAVDAMGELINLNQFDHVGFVDMEEALKYHIVEGVYLEEDLVPGTTLTTIQGQDLIISEVNGNLDISGGKIVQSNNTAYNGVAHVIDMCLAPEGFPEATIWEIIKQSPNHTILESAVINAGLVEELRNQNDLDPSLELPGPFTLFAPTDAAFEALAEDLGYSISELLSGQFIDNIVKTHLIGSKNLSGSLFNGQILANYEGDFIEVDVNGDGIFVNDVKVQTPDLLAYNGVVHVLNEVIAPDLPPVAGSCGTWTIVLKSSFGGWEGSSIELYINDEEITSETLVSGASASFQFGVDAEAVVDIYFNNQGGASGISYEVYDENNVKLFATAGNSNNFGPQSVRGLRACQKALSCGDFEIQMFDEYGDGWDFGSLDVYKNQTYFQTINMPIGSEQVAFIPTEKGDILDFLYYGGAYQQENAFIIYDPSGAELANEYDFMVAPNDVTDIEACPNPTSTKEINSVGKAELFPNPTSGFLNIRSQEEIQSIRVFDLMGRKVFDAPYQNEAIDLSFLKAQNYVVELQKELAVEIHRIQLLK